jgi:hypothetical protein
MERRRTPRSILNSSLGHLRRPVPDLQSFKNRFSLPKSLCVSAGRIPPMQRISPLQSLLTQTSLLHVLTVPLTCPAIPDSPYAKHLNIRVGPANYSQHYTRRSSWHAVRGTAAATRKGLANILTLKRCSQPSSRSFRSRFSFPWSYICPSWYTEQTWRSYLVTDLSIPPPRILCNPFYSSER